MCFCLHLAVFWGITKLTVLTANEVRIALFYLHYLSLLSSKLFYLVMQYQI